MKKSLIVLIVFITCLTLCFSSAKVYASPENALLETKLAEELLIKIQNSNENDEELEKLYLYLDVIYHENTQFYSYKIEELEKLMDNFRESILKSARNLAQNKEYKQAVEFLQSKSGIFKDKSVINSLIAYYSKFFIKEGLFYYENPPEILSINKLIAYPSIAFSDDIIDDNLENNYLTNKEFPLLLSQLHKNNYCLINLSDYIEITENSVVKKDIYMPLNKKPLILIFNNLNYNFEPSFIEKYIVDAKENIACYSSKQAEKNQISYNCDLIPILEKFIEDNKDFSLNNAKALITFNKNSAILGYNIAKNNPNQSQEMNNLKKLVNVLKEKNYLFAYENSEINSYSKEDFEKESEYMQDTLKPVFGNINYFSLGNNNFKYSNFKMLNNLGFKVFISLSSQSSTIFKTDYAIINTTHLNLNTLCNNVFDLNMENIYDHANRKKVFNY